MYVQQKAQLLLRSIKCDDIQVQTTMGIIRDRYLNDFDAACLTLSSRTVSSRFASIEPGKNKRSIGATTTNTRNTRGSVGRGRGCSGGRANQNGGHMKVMMNGVDVSDIHCNFTSDEWDKLRMVGGHTYIYQRRDYLNTRGSGRSDGRGGGGRSGGGRGYGDRGSYSGRGGRLPAVNANHPNEPRAIAAAGVSDSTEIVEYDADAVSNVSPRVSSNSGNSDRGGRMGGRFGPRRDQQY
jgi:hypothetical protein